MGLPVQDCRETARGGAVWGGSPDWQSQTGRVSPQNMSSTVLGLEVRGLDLRVTHGPLLGPCFQLLKRTSWALAAWFGTWRRRELQDGWQSDGVAFRTPRRESRRYLSGNCNNNGANSCSIHHIVALRGLNAICQTWKRNQQTNEVEQLSRPGVVCNTRKRQTRATLLYDCPGLRSLPVASFSGPGNRHLQAKNHSEHKLLHYSCYAWLLLNWVDVPCTSASSWPSFSTVA